MTETISILAALLLATQAQPTDQETAAVETAAVEEIEETSTTSDEIAAEEVEANKMICRRTAIIGSRFKKRICATRREWDNLADRSEEKTRDMQRRNRGFEPAN